MKTSNKKFTLSELAGTLSARLEGDGRTEITGVAPIEKARVGDISFVANKKYLKYIDTTEASALVLRPDTACHRCPALYHEDPYLTFARIIDLFFPILPLMEPGIDRTAVIGPDTEIAPTTAIGPLCHISRGARLGSDTQLLSSVYIGENVIVGDNCLFYPGVKIMADCKIGDNVILHPGVVIGSDGFGYAWSGTEHKKIQQIGWVEIDDEVEIGANTTVDRGALGPTRIGRGTKIDNLVQIAHNVEIGAYSIIVSQVGISGSTKIGNGVIIAGQAGLIGHLEIGDKAIIGAQAGVSKSIPAGKAVLGSPARDIMEEKRINTIQKRLPELLKRIKQLEDKLGD
ncbi:MAG: UDP-3-O-(3-hydroxymyristoyl)glucosamine N-acyltransferase [Candidatus Zixiibacteriota bacterium]